MYICVLKPWKPDLIVIAYLIAFIDLPSNMITYLILKTKTLANYFNQITKYMIIKCIITIFLFY